MIFFVCTVLHHVCKPFPPWTLTYICSVEDELGEKTFLFFSFYFPLYDVFGIVAVCALYINVCVCVCASNEKLFPFKTQTCSCFLIFSHKNAFCFYCYLWMLLRMVMVFRLPPAHLNWLCAPPRRRRMGIRKSSRSAKLLLCTLVCSAY